MDTSPIKTETLENAQVVEQTFDFPEAIRKITAGGKVHKLEWKDREEYGFLNGEWLSIHHKDGNSYKWLINSGDLVGKDYISI